MPDGRPVQSSLPQRIAPCDDMGWGNDPKLLWVLDAHKQHEVLDGVLVGSLRIEVPDVPEPFDFWRNIGQALEVCRGQEPRLVNGFDGYFDRIHRRILLLIKSVIK